MVACPHIVLENGERTDWQEIKANKTRKSQTYILRCA
jgi:hypothetical protein